MKKVKRFVKRVLYSNLPSATVLMFHHIDDGNLLVRSGCRLAKSRFLEIIDAGIPFISLEEYVTFPLSKRNPCAITFDDGLADVYHVAYPELKKRKIPFAVFVVTEFLDEEGYITTDELLQLAADPLVTIGAHGVTHDVLRGMSLDRQKEELENSKLFLQKILNMPVKFFAYSHGQYDAVTLDILQKEKYYDYAFSASGGVTNWLTSGSQFALPRMNCEDGLANFRLKKKQNGTCLIPNI